VLFNDAGLNEIYLLSIVIHLKIGALGELEDIRDKTRSVIVSAGRPEMSRRPQNLAVDALRKYARTYM
jgi:hypothetical protein